MVESMKVKCLGNLVRLADRISQVSVRSSDANDRQQFRFVTDLRAGIDHNGREVLEEKINVRTATSGST